MRAEYDERYLAGILLFNDWEFFAAHEAWEEIWMHTASPERKFYQGLIQAAVGLQHFVNGNLRGATKLYHSGRNYMLPFAPRYQGLDVERFWREMEQCFEKVLGPDAAASVELDTSRVPNIELDPAPTNWPDVARFLEADEKKP